MKTLEQRQKPGRNLQMLEYMRKQAQAQNISPAGYCGYITFDEMSVQEDVQLRRKGKDEANVASHLLQFMFIGSTGFKFPVCYFPTIEVDPTTLYHHFWNAVFDVAEFGFKVFLAICDGAQANRTFVQCHFNGGEDAIKENFTTTNIYTGEPLVFMVDPSLRNNLLKSSSNGKSPRHFKLDGKEILWAHLRDAYMYDVEKNPFQTFKFLTPQHFEPGSAEKMRNYLADDVLGKRMLEVLQNYQAYLQKNDTGNNSLEKTAELLSTTSCLIKNFKNKKPYRSIEDERFIENQQCFEWLERWQAQAKNAPGVTPKEKVKMFLSEKTKFDVYSMILGFKVYCDILFKMYPGSSVCACYTNQDKLENFFGEQRAHNGQTTNPTILQTEHSTLGIIQMQEYKRSKGNCAETRTGSKCLRI
ncbi:hypothetical protein AC249_AIPGENE22554 [Exaiptasia diaphana]|nr:hypothetical protein AC249_AIPGENE22554 [Exaiptasia diaphana]